MDRGQICSCVFVTSIKNDLHYRLLVGNKFIPFLEFQLHFLIVIELELFLEIWNEKEGFSTISILIDLVSDGTSNPMIGSTAPLYHVIFYI